MPSSRTPVPKVAAGGVAGAVSVLLIYVLGLFGVEMDAVTAGAVVLLLQFAAAYIKA